MLQCIASLTALYDTMGHNLYAQSIDPTFFHHEKVGLGCETMTLAYDN